MPGTTQRLLATMITTTTYGTWLPGDLRGYVERGRVWTAGYDAGFCFDEDALDARRDYIRRHHGCRLVLDV